jgi:hypothetical protein
MFVDALAHLADAWSSVANTGRSPSAPAHRRRHSTSGRIEGSSACRRGGDRSAGSTCTTPARRSTTSWASPQLRDTGRREAQLRATERGGPRSPRGPPPNRLIGRCGRRSGAAMGRARWAALAFTGEPGSAKAGSPGARSMRGTRGRRSLRALLRGRAGSSTRHRRPASHRVISRGTRSADNLADGDRAAPAEPLRKRPTCPRRTDDGGWQRPRLFEAITRAWTSAQRSSSSTMRFWSDDETLEWVHYLLRAEPPRSRPLAGRTEERRRCGSGARARQSER